MIITRLRLTNFGRHRSLDVGLGPGLNVVRGANEAGKSTLQRAIEMALFRRPTFSGAELDETRPWQDPQSEPTIDLDFTDEGHAGTIHKNFAGGKGTVTLTLGEESFNDPATVDQHVVALTGIPSEKFFRASASVHHQELTGLAQDEDTLRDRLQQSMSGADRGIHTARRKLQEAIRRYRTEGAKNPGYMKVMRADVERLRDQVRRGEMALVQLEADRRALADARMARMELDTRLAEQREGAAKAERALALNTRQTESAKRYALYKRAGELREDIGKLEASHPSAVALPALRSSVEYLRKLEFSLSEMRAELAAEPDLSGYEVSIPNARWRPWVVVALVALLGGAICGFVGLQMGMAAAGLGVAGALVVIAVIALLLSARGRTRQTNIRLQNELREGEIARRLAGRTDLAERVRQTEQDRAQAMSSLGLSDLAVAETTLAAETDHVAKIGSRRAEYRGLMGDDPTDEDVVELRDKAAADGEEARHALAGMGEMGKEPERYLSGFQLAITRLAPEREAAISAEAQAEARVNANEIDAESVTADAESLSTAEENLAAAERRLRIYEDVLATLNAAERGTMKKAARFLEGRMARDIERISGGRYRRLRVDEGTLTFSVHSPETDGWIDVRRLSQGTLDALYLCARLGIVRQVTAPAAPPIVLDDPFVTFDDERATRALALLKDMSRDLQVILLTTSDRYDQLADNVVVLPAPAERDDPEPVAPTPSAESMSVWSRTALPPTEPRPAEPRASAPRPPSVMGNGAANGAGNGNAPVEPAPLWPAEDR
ncbi:MAG: AAA family ATPase [Candidatus Limnocylindrales bacterium]